MIYICKYCNNSYESLKYSSICTKCRKDYYKTYKKNWYIKNKQHCISQHKNNYIKNRDHILQINKLYRENNYIQIKKAAALYRKTKEYKTKRNNYLINRRKTNPLFKLNYVLNNRFREILKYKKFNKSKTLNLDWLQIKLHLERQFNSKMSWENHGTYWSIEHKIPLSWFDNINDLLLIGWNINNICPLEISKNIGKKNRYAIVENNKFYDKKLAIERFKNIYKIY